MLAEDDEDNRRLIRHILGKAGAWVEAVGDGQQAMECALAAQKEGDSFRVILMDMQMPVMDGYSATRALRNRGYAGPIVALTAHAMGGDSEDCFKAGCNDYATKPIQRTNLISMIRKWADRNRVSSSAVSG